MIFQFADSFQQFRNNSKVLSFSRKIVVKGETPSLLTSWISHTFFAVKSINSKIESVRHMVGTTLAPANFRRWWKHAHYDSYTVSNFKNVFLLTIWIHVSLNHSIMVNSNLYDEIDSNCSAFFQWTLETWHFYTVKILFDWTSNIDFPTLVTELGHFMPWIVA